jgi:hypothetical protein
VYARTARDAMKGVRGGLLFLHTARIGLFVCTGAMRP